MNRKLAIRIFILSFVILLPGCEVFSDFPSGSDSCQRKPKKTACLGGHLFYEVGYPGHHYWNFIPIVNDDGKPVKCSE